MGFCSGCNEPENLCHCPKVDTTVVQRGDGSRVPLDTDEYDGLKEQISRQRTDKDRMRLIKNIAENYSITCQQAKEIIDLQHMSDGKVDAGVTLHPVIVDPEKFSQVLQDAYKFEEERADVRKALGL
eukprot:GFYU01017880.1.p1 GENE.GFYU01017880.1~~GFYU01017880.1.p1  ORF type:complete len:139 (-),score=40.19 GFYU01017880.1:340-720(-)